MDLLKSLKAGQKRDAKTFHKLQELASDSFGMMSSINNKILQRRREAIAPELNADYRQLKNDVPWASKLLFRDDLKSRLTELKACNKASKGALKGDLRNKLSSKNSHGGLKRGSYTPTFNRSQKRSYYNNSNKNYNNNNNNNKKHSKN